MSAVIVVLQMSSVEADARHVEATVSKDYPLLLQFAVGGVMASTMWLLGLIKRPNVDKDLVRTCGTADKDTSWQSIYCIPIHGNVLACRDIYCCDFQTCAFCVDYTSFLLAIRILCTMHSSFWVNFVEHSCEKLLAQEPRPGSTTYPTPLLCPLM